MARKTEVWSPVSQLSLLLESSLTSVYVDNRPGRTCPGLKSDNIWLFDLNLSDARHEVWVWVVKIGVT